MDGFPLVSFRDLARKVDLDRITSRRAGESKGEFVVRQTGILIPPRSISAGDKPPTSEYG